MQQTRTNNANPDTDAMQTANLKDLLKGYSAVVLDASSVPALTYAVSELLPNDWRIVCHHMTIDPFNPDADERIGQEVELTAYEVGISDKALAVKVKGYDRKTNNAFPHVTIAINLIGGGRPKDSNTIEKWTPMTPVKLRGTIQAVRH